MRKTRLLIVEEALKNRSGHWYEYNRAIIEEARERGCEVTVLAHLNIEDDIREELGAEAFFPVTSWDQVYSNPNAWRRYFGILRHNFLVASKVREHFLKQDSPYDVVLVPTVVLYHWIAWRWLVYRGAGRWFTRVCLTTRNNAGEYDPDRGGYIFNASARILSLILNTFRGPIRKGNVTLASDSGKLARQYTELSGVHFETHPHPRSTVDLPTPPIRAHRREKVFTTLGPPRYEKGSDLILQAVEKLLKSDPEFPGRFVLHWCCEVYSPNGTHFPIPTELLASPKVKILRESLTSADYQKRLNEADVILLPYRREQYHARLSGIAIEAFQNGVPCICVADTWVEDCMNEIGGGISINEESVVALVTALKEASIRKDFYLPEERVEAARKQHSPKSFVDHLLGMGTP